MPLWDNRVISFWSHIPVDLRYQRKFYYEAIGEEMIESTNDQTISKNIASFVRNNLPVLRTLFRYSFRIKEYFNHPFRWGHIVPLKKYLHYLFLGGENFQINYIVSHEYIVNNIKDKSWENDN
jgi:asparagine synthase (glutamine-hydrolysing)